MTSAVLKYPSERLKNLHTEARLAFGNSYVEQAEKIGSVEATIRAYNSTRWVHAILLFLFSLAVYAAYIFTLQYGWKVVVSPITGVPAPKFAHLLGLAAFTRFWFIGLPSQKMLNEQDKRRKAEAELLWLDRYRRDWGRHSIGLLLCGMMALIFWTIS